MSQIKKSHCYTDLLGKMDALDMQVNRIKQQLKELKNMIKGTTNTEPDGPATQDGDSNERRHKQSDARLTSLEPAVEGEEA